MMVLLRFFVVALLPPRLRCVFSLRYDVGVVVQDGCRSVGGKRMPRAHCYALCARSRISLLCRTRLDL
jgi:hypothetical protein